MKMKSLLLAGALLVAVSVAAQSETENSRPTPAQQKITWAQKRVEKNPRQYQAYNDWALALAQRARETARVELYAQAEDVLKKSFELAPDNFEGRKVRVWLLLGQHDFAAALAEAQELNRRAPDDVMVYGLIVDAQVHLGNYAEAEKAAQWMLDLRPGNVPGLTRAAHLRELFGDVDGAVELMQMAYTQLSPSETEERAWLLTQMAHLNLSLGRVELAAPILEQALKLFPDYHYALAAMAELRAAQGRHAEAAQLLRRRYLAAPHAENLFDLAVALHRAGNAKESAIAFAEFEKQARSEIESVDNANRELTFYYCDIAHRPVEALRVAEVEIARRRDVHTLDAYAWALFRNRRFAEAQKQIESALAVGVRDARLFYHAGAIAEARGNAAAAREYYRKSLDTNGQSSVATLTRAALERLDARATLSPVLR
jgi:tetratricopeptide (TPR) repeat protein